MDDIRKRKLWELDLRTMGELFNLLITRGGLKQATVASAAGFRRQKVNKMILEDKYSLETANEVAKAIAEKRILNITASQRRRLMQMIPFSHGSLLEDLENELSATGLEYISRRDRNDSLQHLVEQLEKVKKPAFIMDDLWFVHAYNGASLGLFGVDYKGRDKDKLRNWQAWHVIATKFTSGSIIRNAHIEPNLYFRPVVEEFCNDVRDFLFTAQVRMLLKRINELSEPHNFGFKHMWRRAVTFDSEDLDLEGFRRTLVHPSEPDKRLEAQAMTAFNREIEVVKDSLHSTRYRMVVWNGNNPQTERFFYELGERNQDILFAFDYDKNMEDRFHVNDWPEVREHKAMIEKAQ